MGTTTSSLCSCVQQREEPSPNENENENIESTAHAPISCSQQQRSDDDDDAQNNYAAEQVTSSSAGAATSETNVKCNSCGCNHDSILKMATCGVDAHLDALLHYIPSLLTNATQSSSSSQNRQQSDDEKVPSLSYVDSLDLLRLKDLLSDSANCASDLVSTLLRLKDLLSDSANCASDLKESLSKGGTDVLKDVGEIVLKGIGKAHWVTAGLLVLAFVLERIDMMSANRKECLDLLHELFRLGRYIKELKQRPPLKEKLTDLMEESIRLIVKGTIMCCSQRAKSWWHRFLGAKVNKERLTELLADVEKFYRQLVMHMILYTYDANKQIQFPRQLMYPAQAVGIEKHVQTVVEMLEFHTDRKVLAVLVFGFGGIGKTVLGDAVYSSVDIPGFGFSKVKLFETIHCKPIITKLQKQIMDDISGNKYEEPRSDTEGQNALQQLVESTPCFVYVDNALDAQQLSMLLPKRLHNCNKLRLLLTARIQDVADSVHAPDYVKIFSVSSMDKKDGDELLQQLLGESARQQLKRQDFQELSRICGGVPLFIELVGNFIANHAHKSMAMQVIRREHARTGGESFALKNVDFFSFALDGLPNSYKEAFFDICILFPTWDEALDHPTWDEALDLFGDDTVEALERRALIKNQIPKIDDEDFSIEIKSCETLNEVVIHDVILEIARNKNHQEAHRVTDLQHLRKLLQGFQDNQHQVQDHDMLRDIKGIVLQTLEDERDEALPVKMPAAVLDTMSHSLRHFSTLCPHKYEAIQVEGKCKCTSFPQLIRWHGENGVLPFDVHGAPSLKDLRYSPDAAVDLVKLPRNLASLVLSLQLLDDNEAGEDVLVEPSFNVRFPHLKQLVISNSASLLQLPRGFVSCLPQLRVLRIFGCQRICEIPHELHLLLPNLKILAIKRCPKITRLLSNVNNSWPLEVLLVERCDGLEELFDGFCGLSSLAILGIRDCKSFVRFPQNVDFPLLKMLALDGCHKLVELSPRLAVDLPHLEFLDLDKCNLLERKWMDVITRIKSLKAVNIQECHHLIERWEEIKGSQLTNIACLY